MGCAVLVLGMAPWSGVLCCRVAGFLGRALCGVARPAAMVARAVLVCCPASYDRAC